MFDRAQPGMRPGFLDMPWLSFYQLRMKNIYPTKKLFCILNLSLKMLLPALFLSILTASGPAPAKSGDIEAHEKEVAAITKKELAGSHSRCSCYSG